MEEHDDNDNLDDHNEHDHDDDDDLPPGQLAEGGHCDGDSRIEMTS